MTKSLDIRRWLTGLGMLLLASVTMVTLLAVSTQAQAETVKDNVEMTLSPTRVKLSLNPNSQEDKKFKVINTGKSEFTFKVYTAPYQVADEKYNPTFNTETNRTQISRWIIVPKEEFSLKPGEDVEIPYSVSVPSDVPSGGQYAAIFAETTDDSDAGGSIVAKKRVGLLVHSRISGDTRDSGEIVSYDYKKWQYEAPLNTTWRIKNTGNTDFEVSTQMKVKNIWGKEVYSSEEVKSIVFPETTRAIDVSWTGAGNGLYRVTNSVNFLGKSENKQNWVLVMSPIVAILIIAVLLLVIGGILYAIRKKRHSRTIKK